MCDFYSNPGIKQIFFKGKVLPREYIISQVSELSAYLKSSIVPSGSNIYLFAYNHPKAVIAYFAILKAGHHCVLIDPQTGRLELEEYRADTTPRAEIMPDTSGLDWDRDKEIIINHGMKIREVDFPVMDEPCTMLYTAAYDGYAKAAVLGASNIFADAEAHAQTNQSDSGSVVCALLPFHHLFGMTIGIVAPSLSGCSVDIEDISDMRRIKEISGNLLQNKISHLYSIPALFYLLSKIPDGREKFAKIRFMTSGGYKLSAEIFARCQKMLGHELREGYGLTEASPVVTWNHPPDAAKAGSVGTPFRCCAVEIQNDQGEKLANGSVGEVCVKGRNVMKGYYGNRIAAERVLKDGMLNTGDLGYIDKQGYVFITGTKRNVLKISGKAVFPEEVKRLIMQNENVEDVHVYADNDNLTGPTLRATISLKSLVPIDEKKIATWIMANLSPNKKPKIALHKQ